MQVLGIRSSLRLASPVLGLRWSSGQGRGFATLKPEPKIPKKAATAYAQFYKEKYATMGSSDVTASAATIAAAWRLLSAEQKQPYVQRYQEQKVVADKARNAWRGMWEVKRPKTSFSRYLIDRRKELLAENASEYTGRAGAVKAMTMAAKEWASLPSSKKDSYRAAYQRELKTYHANPLVQSRHVRSKEEQSERAKKARALVSLEKRREKRARGEVVKRRKKPGMAAATKKTSKKKSSVGRKKKRSSTKTAASKSKKTKSTKAKKKSRKSMKM